MSESFPKLIGITGHAGSGKNMVASFICNTFQNHYEESFATPLKDAAAAAFGIPRHHFDDRELKETPDDYWNVSPRKIVQFVGTELFRNSIGGLVTSEASFWINRTVKRLTNLYIPEGQGEYESTDTVVIPDVRFQNEYDFVIANGGIVICLTRPGFTGDVGIPNHASEQSIKFKPERTYQCVNNSTPTALYKQISDIIIANQLGF